MLETFKKHNVFSFIIILPLIWAFSGLFILDNGSKILNALVPLAFFIRLIHIGYSDIPSTIKNNKFLWILITGLILCLIAHFTYGVSSNTFRVISLVTLYLIALPKGYLSRINLKYLTWLLSISLLLFLLSQHINGNLFNRYWSINPIRIGFVSGFISIINLYYFINSKTKTHQWISFALAFLSLFPLILSASRGPWLSYLFGLIILITTSLRLKKTSVKLIISIMVIMVISGLALEKPIEKRVVATKVEFERIKNNDMNSSIGLRFQMWQAGITIIKDNWLLGVGDKGQIKEKEAMIAQGTYTREAAHFVHFHNQWINDLAKHGIIGLFFTLSLIVYPLYKIKPGQNKNIFFILIGMYLVLSITDMPFERAHQFYFYLILTYILISTNKENNTEQKH
ncbi:O-antigen ligase family protein [Vibrio kanaloae]|uniref:O-antigen ligase family protein n=1 Tax=Vibrio kanaloae TaxID=170673 RepID=UPI0011B8399F|nr:O-antigen ligase family protein [Vibrio kanaloae]